MKVLHFFSFSRSRCTEQLIKPDQTSLEDVFESSCNRSVVSRSQRLYETAVSGKARKQGPQGVRESLGAASHHSTEAYQVPLQQSMGNKIAGRRNRPSVSRRSPSELYRTQHSNSANPPWKAAAFSFSGVVTSERFSPPHE